MAAYCKDSSTDKLNKLVDFPGVKSEERIETYRRLVFGVVSSALTNAYPITKKLLGNERFEELMEDFFANYDCGYPELWTMPYGLYEYVSENNILKEEFPFIDELIYFEWVEIEVYMMEDEEPPSHRTLGDLERDKIVLNPEFRLTVFDYPVFRENANSLKEVEKITSQKAQYILLTFREPETCRVRFMEISGFCAALISNISLKPSSAREAIKQTAEEFGTELEENAETNMMTFVKELISQKMVLGFL